MTEARSRAFLYGESVFSTLRVEGGKAFFAQAHEARLNRGAQWLWGETPVSLKEKIAHTLSHPPQGEGVWRVSLHALSTRDQKLNDYQVDSWWTEGLAAVVPLKLVSVFLAGRPLWWPSDVKTADYLQRSMAAKHLDAGVLPLFVLENQKICESLYANVLFWDGAEWIFPRPSADVLDGIGQRKMQEVFQALHVPFKIREIFSIDLAQFQSAFLINAVRGPMVIESIDGRAYRAHPRYEELRREFFGRD